MSSEQPNSGPTSGPDSPNRARDFKKVRGRVLGPAAFIEMWVAVYANDGQGEVLLGAPTLDELVARWYQFAFGPFDRDQAQRVVVAHYPKFEPLTEPSPLTDLPPSEVVDQL